MGKFWGPKPSLTKWLYTNIVRPTFTYGCIAWAKTTRTKDFINRAKRLQRLALKDIGPIRTHSPTSGIEIATNTMPLDLYIRGEFISAHFRIRKVIPTIAGTTDTISSHYAWAHKLRDEAGIHNIPYDITLPYFHAYKNYKCITTQYHIKNETVPNKIQVFTDGSKININGTGFTGSGYVIYGLHTLDDTGNPKILYEQSAYLGTTTTVFQAEVFAIGHAVHHILINRQLLADINCVDIITDSKSALQALDGITSSSKLVIDCMKALDKLAELTIVKIHWIKAHVGHIGNERADQLAKKGTQNITYATEPILPVPKAWIKRKINNYLYQEWTNRWLGNMEARQTKIFFPTPNPNISKKLLSYDRQECARLFRWISGLSFHRYHNHLLQPETYPDPSCRLCSNDKEETSHLFATCPGLAHIRQSTIGQLSLTSPIKWSPHQLLSMIHRIDQICPEEGTIDNAHIDIDNEIAGLGSSQVSE
jgi:ribonuclease HI